MWYNELHGYKFMYRIGENGIVEKRNSKGEWKQLKPFMSCGSPTVKLRTISGGVVKRRVIELMQKSFFGYKEGYCLDFKSNDHTDCSTKNLKWITEREMIARHHKCNAVCKIDEHGKIIARYPTLKDAAESNFVSIEAVADRCNGKVKYPFRNYGFSFKYDKKGE